MGMNVGQLKASIQNVSDITPVKIQIVIPGGTASVIIPGFITTGTTLQKDLEAVFVAAEVITS